MTIELYLAHLSAAIIAAIPSVIALFKLHELHVTLNSRLTELLRTTRAEGVSEGKAMPKEN